MKSIGITGGIGSGKSLVCKIIEKLGYPVFYADEAAKKLMVEEQTLKSELIHLLGENTYSNNELNRPFIAEEIFKNPELKNEVSALVHPAVYRAYENWKIMQKSDLVFNESALLFETGSYKSFDATILVTANKETRIQRVMERDGLSRDAVLERISNQLDDDSKQKLCDFEIVNDEQKLIIPEIIKILRLL
jgi:dephospho-CoA kinase